MRQLLRPLPAPEPHLIRLHADHVPQAHPHLLGLDEGVHDGLHLRQVHPLGKGGEGIAPRRPHRHIAQDAAQFLGDGSLHLLRHLPEGGVDTQAGLHGGREQVDGVGECLQDALLALARAVVQPGLRQVQPQQARQEDETEAHCIDPAPAGERQDQHAGQPQRAGRPEHEQPGQAHRVTGAGQTPAQARQQGGRQHAADGAQHGQRHRPPHTLQEARLPLCGRVAGRYHAAERLEAPLHHVAGPAHQGQR